MYRARGEAAEPLQAIAERIKASRKSAKIARVALARHMLRIAFYMLRDNTSYDPKRLRSRPALAAA